MTVESVDRSAALVVAHYEQLARRCRLVAALSLASAVAAVPIAAAVPPRLAMYVVLMLAIFGAVCWFCARRAQRLVALARVALGTTPRLMHATVRITALAYGGRKVRVTLSDDGGRAIRLAWAPFVEPVRSIENAPVTVYGTLEPTTAAVALGDGFGIVGQVRPH